MPPRVRKQAEDDAAELSLRFKRGRATIFQIVDPVTKFERVEEELLEAIRERNREDPEHPMEIPDEGDDFEVVYAILKAPTDPSMGWKRLTISGDATPASLGLKNNAVIGFAIIGSEDSPEDITFDVDFATIPDDEVQA